MAEVVFTEEQLQQKCAEWQKRLRLQDWIVKIRLCRAHELPIGSLAHVHYTVEKKMASIRITDPVDYPPDSMVPYDMENSLVHELLHLHLAPITGDKASIEEEQAIECITSGLLGVHRSQSQKESIIEKGDIVVLDDGYLYKVTGGQSDGYIEVDKKYMPGNDNIDTEKRIKISGVIKHIKGANVQKRTA